MDAPVVKVKLIIKLTKAFSLQSMIGSNIFSENQFFMAKSIHAQSIIQLEFLCHSNNKS